MKTVVVIGAGHIGSTIAHLLSDSGDYRVTVADQSAARLKALGFNPRIEQQLLDVTDAGALRALLTGKFAVLSAAPYHLTFHVAQAAKAAGAHYLDLTEDVATTRKVKALANDATTAFIPQCGLAPGFISIVAADLADGFDTLHDVRLRVGALPKYPSNALNYNLTWSTDGVINEYCEPCEAIVDGHPRHTRALEECEAFALDGVAYEAFNTSGGLGTLCETLSGRVRNLNYRTIRYPGHAAIMKALLNDLRLRDRRDLLKDILEHALPATLQDVVIVFVTVSGLKNGQLVQETYANKIYAREMGGRMVSAIQITTALGALRGARPSRRGGAAAGGLRAPGGDRSRRFPGQPVWPRLRHARNRAARARRAAGAGDRRVSGLRRRAADVGTQVATLLDRLGVDKGAVTGGGRAVTSPIDGQVMADVHDASPALCARGIEAAHQAFLAWRVVPPPRRGELVRLLGEALRAAKSDLGLLVTLEAGKTISEGLGEVQEMIDICDYAVGLSRQLFGLTLATERPDHRMMETWQPLGVVGIISAFNFPVAVWSWNAALALVCGDAVIWKPSEKTPLTALAVQAVFERVAARFADAPANLSTVLIGDRTVGEALVAAPKVRLLSATGSTAMGRAVAPVLAARFARALLELGGNNAAIVCPSADLDLTIRAVAFAAMGTAGQRCTTLRRLFVHDDVYDALLPRLKSAFASVRVGDPRDAETLVGPLIDRASLAAMQRALGDATAQGGQVFGGERIEGPGAGIYVRPALVEMPGQEAVVRRETFAPILYVMRYRDLAAAIALNNDAPQGLSSSIFTSDLREAERFCSAQGSDCGIANVNIGPSGAEIGGAFGGEKETGGGREAGSDSWRAYMRRATNTVNYGTTLPLAQGVTFEI